MTLVFLVLFTYNNKNSIIKLDLKYIVYDARNHELEKERKLSINSPVLSGGQGKYVKYVNILWPPLEAAKSIFNLRNP
jgi:hypothetical protein